MNVKLKIYLYVNLYLCLLIFNTVRAPGQLYDSSRVGEATLKDMGKADL